jgi:hypothetical protein
VPFNNGNEVHLQKTLTVKSSHKFCWQTPLEFQSKFYHDSHYQPLLAYKNNPYVLVRSSVLSVMCECAQMIDLNDQEESTNVQHSYKLMHHPLCKQLTQLKWRQFGLPLFLTSFFIYCLYLVLFTATMLRNKQLEYFYRLVNASFPNGRFSNGNQLVSICDLVRKHISSSD